MKVNHVTRCRAAKAKARLPRQVQKLRLYHVLDCLRRDRPASPPAHRTFRVLPGSLSAAATILHTLTSRSASPASRSPPPPPESSTAPHPERAPQPAPAPAAAHPPPPVPVPSRSN